MLREYSSRGSYSEADVLLHAEAPSRVAGSFRDPAGYVFEEGGVIKRAVLEHGLADYEHFMSSGLYGELAEAGLIVRHTEEKSDTGPPGVKKILVPEQIEFLSYPYEWCFSQFKAAAMLTLDIQLRALRRGMTLKDASAYNVQFRGAHPVFIDTLSFERNGAGPWEAYRQFCQEFLSPILLMAHVSETFGAYMLASPGGFSIGLTSRLLPWKTYLRLGTLLHIHLHARTTGEQHAGSTEGRRADRKRQLAESLRESLAGISMRKRRTAWTGYYKERTHYSEEAESSRQQFVQGILRHLRPKLVFDLGANTGQYSRIASGEGCRCVAFELDSACAEENYIAARRLAGCSILPLRMDLRFPSPGLGMDGKEHKGLLDRPRAGLILALAFLHHLRFTGNVPLNLIAKYLAALGDHLVLEFVPREDPMVKSMLVHRKDVFFDYTREGLMRAFQPQWELREERQVQFSPRTLIWFQSRSAP